MLRELVSDWELEEIRHELAVGTAPDVVEFRHGLPKGSVGRRHVNKGVQRHAEHRAWSYVELAFVRDNYPHHDRWWPGWGMLKRTWPSIAEKAHTLGVTKKQRERPWTSCEVAFLTDNYPNHGKSWDGWKNLKRTWDAIKMKASYLGVRKGRGKEKESKCQSTE